MRTYKGGEKELELEDFHFLIYSIGALAPFFEMLKHSNLYQKDATLSNDDIEVKKAVDTLFIPIYEAVKLSIDIKSLLEFSKLANDLRAKEKSNKK